jgi:cytoskeletal protein CcmA (bactofilin family)
MTGNIESSGKTCIRSSGSLVGDVVTRGIVIENGAVFRGNLEIVTRPNQAPELKNGGESKNGGEVKNGAEVKNGE